jgi:hypothetical protein
MENNTRCIKKVEGRPGPSKIEGESFNPLSGGGSSRKIFPKL